MFAHVDGIDLPIELVSILVIKEQVLWVKVLGYISLSAWINLLFQDP